MTTLGAIDWAAIVLVILGAINWLMVGLFGFDVVQFLFGGVPPVNTIIYVAIGLGGLWLLYTVARIATPSRAAP